MKKTLLTATALSITLSAAPVMAQNGKQMTMEEIQAQLQQLSAQVQNLSNVVEQQNKVIAQQKAALEAQETQSRAVIKAQVDKEIENHVASLTPAAGLSTADSVKITMSPSPKFESADGKYSFQPFGRVHLDAAFFDDDKSDNSDNLNVRRGRLGVKGKLGEDLKYKTEIDFAEDEADIQDMTLTYTGLDTADVTIGNHRPPLGFERNTSSNYNMFIERAAPTNTFAANRKLGLSAATKADNYVVGIGVFNEDAGNDDTGDDEDFSLDARIAANVLGLYDETQKDVLHLGLGFSHQRPTGAVRYRARPGVGDGVRLIDTGAINDVDDVNIIGAELAGVFGPFSFQSEYFDSSVNRTNASDAGFDGYYAQASYFITGETRNYDSSSGVFKRTKPANNFSLSEGGWGAWEVVTRYDQTDLNDESAGITGGELDTYTIGLNWYLNKNVRLMSNVIKADTDDNAATSPDDDPTIVNLRAQWDF